MNLINELESRLDRIVYTLTRWGLSDTAALYMIIDVCKGRLKNLGR